MDEHQACLVTTPEFSREMEKRVLNEADKVFVVNDLMNQIYETPEEAQRIDSELYGYCDTDALAIAALIEEDVKSLDKRYEGKFGLKPSSLNLFPYKDDMRIPLSTDSVVKLLERRFGVFSVTSELAKDILKALGSKIDDWVTYGISVPRIPYGGSFTVRFDIPRTLVISNEVLSKISTSFRDKEVTIKWTDDVDIANRSHYLSMDVTHATDTTKKNIRVNRMLPTKNLATESTATTTTTTTTTTSTQPVEKEKVPLSDEALEKRACRFFSRECANSVASLKLTSNILCVLRLSIEGWRVYNVDVPFYTLKGPCFTLRLDIPLDIVFKNDVETKVIDALNRQESENWIIKWTRHIDTDKRVHYVDLLIYGKDSTPVLEEDEIVATSLPYKGMRASLQPLKFEDICKIIELTIPDKELQVAVGSAIALNQSSKKDIFGTDGMQIHRITIHERKKYEAFNIYLDVDPVAFTPKDHSYTVTTDQDEDNREKWHIHWICTKTKVEGHFNRLLMKIRPIQKEKKKKEPVSDYLDKVANNTTRKPIPLSPELVRSTVDRHVLGPMNESLTDILVSFTDGEDAPLITCVIIDKVKGPSLKYTIRLGLSSREDDKCAKVTLNQMNYIVSLFDSKWDLNFSVCFDKTVYLLIDATYIKKRETMSLEQIRKVVGGGVTTEDHCEPIVDMISSLVNDNETVLPIETLTFEHMGKNFYKAGIDIDVDASLTRETEIRVMNKFNNNWAINFQHVFLNDEPIRRVFMMITRRNYLCHMK